ncbi:hypothetical protein [Pendulispora albinea]|uniref:Uncharacterized protein n=1 Tax=Pendulispora albinea TaxID=2741071 RepID=A0ABZ2LSC5_9BACT
MSFDLSHAVTFDLARGSVRAIGAERTVLLPVDALFDLVSAVEPEVAASVGRGIGQSIGERLAEQLGGAEGVRASPLDSVINAIAFEFSVAGFGAFGIERWGRAMVLVVEHAPRLGGTFLASVLEGTLEAATQTRVACMLLAAGPVQRILVASPDAIDRVRAYIGEGTSWPDALSRLQARVIA